MRERRDAQGHGAMGVERREEQVVPIEAERRQRTVQDRPPPAPTESPDEQSGPALTIVCDYDIRRIGLRYDLWEEFDQRKPVKLGRLVFTRPGTAERQELAPVVSAQDGNETLTFRMPGSGGVRLTPGPYAASRPAGWLRVTVGGVERSGQVTVTPDEVKEGVCIQLGHYVLLLLHLAPRRRCETAEGTILGESCEVNDLRRRIQVVKDGTSPVLLVGEPGTGKELVAAALHLLAHRRRDQPFKVRSCPTLPAGLAAAELFGQEPAFVGGGKKIRGLFLDAKRGTLFLDEIGELACDVQSMFLRVFDPGKAVALGSTKEYDVECRVVAATSRELGPLVDTGSFDGALYSRLAGCEIHLPPLRERRPDIPGHFIHFLMRAAGAECARLYDPPFDPEDPEPSLVPPLLPDDVLELLNYSWPGNVRQVRDIARAAWSQTRESHRRLGVGKLLAKAKVQATKTTAGSVAPKQDGGPRGAVTLPSDSYKQVDQAKIRAAVEASRGKKKPFVSAAGILGIPYSPAFKSYATRIVNKPNQGP